MLCFSVFIWFYAFIFAVGPLISKHGRYVPEGLGTWCSLDFADKEAKLTMTLIFVLGFFIPVTIMVIAYTGIWIKVKMVRRKEIG